MTARRRADTMISMTTASESRAAVEKFALDLGFSVFGVADITAIRQDFLLSPELKTSFDRAISLGKRLLDSVLDDIQDHPTPLYLHHYRQTNNFLDRGALLLASHIQEMGHRALPIAASQLVDWKKHMGHVPHKKVGLLAGVGWIGRNNLLVNPDFGSRFRLVTVLTDLPIEPDTPLEFGCGTCYKCLDPCPAQAIKRQPAAFDHVGCYNKLDEFRRSHLVSQHICGVCVKACDGLKSGDTSPA